MHTQALADAYTPSSAHLCKMNIGKGFAQLVEFIVHHLAGPTPVLHAESQSSHAQSHKTRTVARRVHEF